MSLLKIYKPIFLIGQARSGTTLLNNLLSLHPDVAWFSSWANRYPQYPQLALFSRLRDWQWFEQISRDWHYIPRPAEAYGIWQYYFEKFNNDARYATPERVVRFRSMVETTIQWQGKSRFLTKYTSLTRIDFVRAIFSDAIFLYIVRDPRAVVQSLLVRKFWLRDNMAAFEKLSQQERLKFYTDKYNEYYQDKKRYEAGKDYYLICYEQLVSNVVETLLESCHQLELRHNEKFIKKVQSLTIESNNNDKWKQNFSLEEQDFLNTALAEPLRELNYAVN